MSYGFREMNEEYLDRLIAEFPQYDYQRQTKKKKNVKATVRKIIGYIIATVIVAVILLTIGCIDCIADVIYEAIRTI